MSESTSLHYLSNGMAVQLQPVADLSAAAVCLRVDAGSHHEPDRWPGLAHLLEHLLFQGGQRFPGPQRLMPWVAARQGRVNATTEACRTLYYFDVRSEELSEGIARLLDMALLPEFSDSSFLSLPLSPSFLSSFLLLLLSAVFPKASLFFWFPS